MKKYYTHNGTSQQGAFDIDELKSQKITKETMIWYEGLDGWKTAEQLPELSELFKLIPPPIVLPTPPVLPKTTTQQNQSKQTPSTVGIRNFSAISIFVSLVGFLSGLISSSMASDLSRKLETSEDTFRALALGLIPMSIYLFIYSLTMLSDIRSKFRRD